MNDATLARPEFFSEREASRSYGNGATESSAMLATEQQTWARKVRAQVLALTHEAAEAWRSNITVAANVIAGVTTETTPPARLMLTREGEARVVRIVWTGSDTEIGLDVFSATRMHLRLTEVSAASAPLHRDLGVDFSPLWSALEKISIKKDIQSSGLEDTLRATELVQKLTDLLKAQRKREAFDLLYREVHAQLNEGSVQKVVASLRVASQSDLPLNVLVGLLTVTLHWRNTLGQSRAALVEHVRQQALIVGGEEKAKALLQGLE
jgi:hypothetical protein